jgi:sialidase-1
MPIIEYVERHVLYENPSPLVHSRHGYFPGLVKLPGGRLLALFVRAEAFEAPDATTYVSHSDDLGRTWSLQGPMFAGPLCPVPTSDYLKATLLGDGRLLAIGYRFRREDPEAPIADERTGGILPGDNIVSISEDGGVTWSAPQTIDRGYPEVLEISGPCIQLRSGDLLAAAGIFRLPDGSNPSGQLGLLLRSRDGGRTWGEGGRFFEAPGRGVTAYEARLCEMQPGRVALIFWAHDVATGRDLPNLVTVSHDDGFTWSGPINTGHFAQASNLLWLGGDVLLSIHAHRASESGLYVRAVDFRNDTWSPAAECVIYGPARQGEPGAGDGAARLFSNIRFGQPSLLRLDRGEVLAVHWAIEEGQGKILVHRLRLHPTPSAPAG